MGVGVIFTRPQYWNPLKLYWPQSLDRILRTLIRRAGSAARVRADRRRRADICGRGEWTSRYACVCVCVFFSFFQVSWVRHRDIHLLTVGVETYTSDQRFVASHFPHTEDWTLQVKYPQRRDSGTYECQVSTTPPIGHSMLLSVVG